MVCQLVKTCIGFVRLLPGTTSLVNPEDTQFLKGISAFGIFVVVSPGQILSLLQKSEHLMKFDDDILHIYKLALQYKFSDVPQF